MIDKVVNGVEIVVAAVAAVAAGGAASDCVVKNGIKLYNASGLRPDSYYYTKGLFGSKSMYKYNWQKGQSTKLSWKERREIEKAAERK